MYVIKKDFQPIFRQACTVAVGRRLKELSLLSLQVFATESLLLKVFGIDIQ